MNAPRHSFTMSAAGRVLDMLNAWFVTHTLGPSYREIARYARVPLQRVRRYLDQLQAMDFLTYTPGAQNSIRMTDPIIPDDVLLRYCHGRNWTVQIPPPQG